MKKILFAVGIILSCALNLSAQEKWSVGAGLGWFGPAYHQAARPDIHLQAEYLVVPEVHAGLQAGYFYRKMPNDNDYQAFHVAIRGAYYFNSLLRRDGKKLDFYAGSGVGLHHFRHSSLGTGRNQFYVPVFIGLDWRFAGKWSLLAELAYNDVGGLKIGVSRKF